MVVGFAADDGTGSIDLLREHEADHLMGEGHLREGQLFVGTGIDHRRESVRTSDDEHQATGSGPFLFQPTGELYASKFLSVFIEQHDGITGLQLFQDQFSLGGFLLFLRQALRILQFWYCHEFEGHIVPDALHIVCNPCLEVLIRRLPHQNQNRLHILKCNHL